MATKATAAKPDPVTDDDAEHRAKHEDTIGVADTKNDIKPEPVEIPDDDAGLADPDDAELAAAEAALAGEVDPGAAPVDGTAPTEPVPPVTPTSPATPAADTQPAAPAGDGQMIPKARFDEVLREKSALEQRNTYLMGVRDTHRTMIGQGEVTDPQQPAQPATPQHLTAAEQVVELRGKRLELAQKYEAGEINVAEHRAADDVIEDAIHEARMAGNGQQPTQTQAQEDLYLEERTAEINAAHGYIAKIAEGDLNYLIGKARNELGFGGRALNTSSEVLALRMRVGELSDTHGPIMLGESAAPGAAPVTPQPPTPPNQPGLSPEAIARQTKLQMAAAHPADLHATGNAAEPNGQPSDAEIERMTDEEIADRLPESTQDRIMQSRLTAVR